MTLIVRFSRPSSKEYFIHLLTMRYSFYLLLILILNTIVKAIESSNHLVLHTTHQYSSLSEMLDFVKKSKFIKLKNNPSNITLSLSLSLVIDALIDEFRV